MLFITQRIEEITASFDRGIILSDGKIASQGTRSEVLTEKNLSDAFGVPVRLHPRPDGRLWPVLG